MWLQKGCLSLQYSGNIMLCRWSAHNVIGVRAVVVRRVRPGLGPPGQGRHEANDAHRACSEMGMDPRALGVSWRSPLM
uniref:Uncharacterized protein n=1 Tax=Knipowitschia caucasica TaxID=637954 RepID=A0AAV2MF65_KNICA